MGGARSEGIIAAFAATLRRVRNAAGLTQEQLAAEAGVDRTFIALLEGGKRQPSLSVICAIAYAVGETPSSLIAEVCKVANAPPTKK